jgi:hypothetical protein
MSDNGQRNPRVHRNGLVRNDVPALKTTRNIRSPLMSTSTMPKSKPLTRRKKTAMVNLKTTSCIPRTSITTSSSPINASKLKYWNGSERRADVPNTTPQRTNAKLRGKAYRSSIRSNYSKIPSGRRSPIMLRMGGNSLPMRGGRNLLSTPNCEPSAIFILPHFIIGHLSMSLSS